MIITILGIGVIVLLCCHINYLYKVNAIDKRTISHLKQVLAVVSRHSNGN